MDLNNSIIFGGIDSANYGIYVAGNAVFNSPERDVTMIDVPGRNGQLTLDNGRYMNIEVTYNAFVAGDNSNDIADNIRGYRNAIGSLIGYQRLEDTFHTDEYRQAIFRNGIEVEPTIYQTGGYFDITFDCKPQRWLTSGEMWVSVVLGPETFNNPTLFASKPLIRVSSADGNVVVGSETIAVAMNPGTISGAQVNIDCELGDAWYVDILTGDIVSLNSYVTVSGDDFPSLSPGSSSVDFTGNITQVDVQPRWWRI